uniref:Terpene synthase metal-binding domain-containing protein n=1 Tax=Quercus lobata TaxID=97700 RepID=A0A7N2LZS8_QUELO
MKEAFQCLEKYHNITRLSSMIVRFANDLGTSQDELKRGDVQSNVICMKLEFQKKLLIHRAATCPIRPSPKLLGVVVKAERRGYVKYRAPNVIMTAFP